MDRKNKIILVTILVLVAIGFMLDFISKVTDKGTPTAFHSKTIEESKDGGYFISEYKPITSKIKLEHHPDSIEFLRLWTEKERDIEKTRIFHQTVLSGQTYFQIDYQVYPSEKFNFQIEGYGGHNGQGTSDFKSDTVTFQIVERSPIDTIGWQEKLTGQQIKFVRTN